MTGRKKCDKCRGKGGSVRVVEAFGRKMEVFEACLQCRSKGVLWPNNEKNKARAGR